VAVTFSGYDNGMSAATRGIFSSLGHAFDRKGLVLAAFIQGVFLLGTLGLAVARTQAADAEPAPLVPIADILSAGSPRQDGAAGETAVAGDSAPPAFGRRVRIRGTVTWCAEKGLMIEDDSDAIWLSVWRARRSGTWQGSDATLAALTPGTEVEVLGITDRAGYSPAVLPVEVTVTGSKALPPARPFDADLFFGGFLEGRRLAVEGVVQAVRRDKDHYSFIVDHYGRRFAVDVAADAFGAAPESLVDGEVRIEGVAVAIFNQRGEFVWPKLLATDRAAFTVVKPAPAAAFDAPAYPLRAVATYRRQPEQGHRVRTEGTVIHIVPGRSFSLQDEAVGVLVESALEEPLAVGDRVEVAGFVRRGNPAASLTDGIYRRIGSATPPEPLVVDADTLIEEVNTNLGFSRVAPPGDSIGCLVTFPARVLGLTSASDGGLVLLSTERSTLNAWAGPDSFAALQGIQPGTLVQVTGVSAVERVERSDARALSDNPFLGRLQVLLRSAADVKVLAAPSWWTPRRLSLALGVVAAAAIFATTWAIMLRRQVRRQLSIIEATLQGEAATEERRRIAREFHDTLEQDLAGVAMRLDVAAERAGDDASRRVLESQRALLERLRAETHDFLWDLRDPTRHDGSLRESLAEQVAALQPARGATIRFEAADSAPSVSPLVQHHLLRIVREAVTNAVRHGGAREVAITLEGRGEHAVVTVADDGGGFDPGARGTLPGHFGIRGMRERARRIGATIDITSRPHAGTIVQVTAPLATATPASGAGREAEAGARAAS